MAFCKNCGNSINENAAVCMSCGFAKGDGSRYCSNCGKETSPGAAICTSCGFALGGNSASVPIGAEQKSKMTAGLLGIFLGWSGAHHFYLGNTTMAIVHLAVLVAGFVGLMCAVGIFILLGNFIWGLVEGILILTKSDAKDAKGVPLK